MTAISTHVLDLVTGSPASGLAVSLSAPVDGEWQTLASGVTDADGRIRLADDVPAGTCRLRFATAEWSAGARRAGTTTFAEVVLTVLVDPRDDRLHIPLLLSPHGYTTYRGS